MRNAIPEKRESRLMSGKLMYMQIEQEIRERIRSGVYAPESQLPTENELGREFGVSRLTVSKSLANLVKENLISRTRGRGSFVNARRREAPESFADPVSEPGIFKFISPPYSNGDGMEHNRLLEGMNDAVRQQGYNISIDFFSSIDEELELLKNYTKPINNGFAVWPASDPATLEQLKIMQRDRFPFVQLDSYFEELNGNYLLTDSSAGARMAVRHLYGLGHREIAYLTAPLDRVSLSERFAGVLAGLAGAGLGIDGRIGVIPTSEEVNLHNIKERQLDFIRSWLDRQLGGRTPPTAIFCSNDTLAVSVFRLLEEKGVRVPDEISLVGFDNISAASWLPVPLTTVAHDFFRIGSLAGKILIQQRRDYNTLPIQYRVQPNLIVRKSTGPAPVK